jgi:ABC transporter with metal-binding/Fe-S-binding domain ATP-binding protein
MKCAVLFSGGKDSTFATYLAKKMGYEISCLISIISDNPESYMFHTPSITKVVKQTEMLDLPLLVKKTIGIKEEELQDLQNVIEKAISNYKIEAVVTGAVESAYQASRIQKICDNLEIECFNPLWQKNQFELLNDLIENDFEIIITGVFAYPFDETWLGRIIDEKFVQEITTLNEKYKINPAGEGGEYETFVFNCPLFKRTLVVDKKHISGKNNSWKMEIEIK